MSNSRFQTRKYSRSCTRIQALSPCQAFAYARGINPFAALLASILGAQNMSPEEKAEQHKIKMSTDQKRAVARSQRRKSTQNRGN